MFVSMAGIDKGPSVVIRENSLEPCSYYQVMVRMTSPSGRSAAAGREFLTNCPPWGGNCSVVPQEGKVSLLPANIRNRKAIDCKHLE